MVRYEVVGSGMIGTALHNIRRVYNTVFHAAGVSNSTCTSKSEFDRDRERLKQSLRKSGLFVYFSSCEQNAATPYFTHKRVMEDLVRERGNYLIVRLPIVAGLSPNPHTLLNYLYQRIARSEAVSIWKGARRRVIDIADVVASVQWLVTDGALDETVNVASPTSVSVNDIVSEFERIIGKPAILNVLDGGTEYDDRIDTSRIAEAPLDFSGDYLGRTIRRYYS